MKKIFGWLHLWLGIASGIVVMIVAATGCILVFEEELEHTFHSSFYYVDVPANTARQPLDNLTAYVLQQNPKYRVNVITVEPENNSTVLFLLQKGKGGNKDRKNQVFVSVNPYTGKIIESIPMSRHFFTVVEQLHRYLCMGEVGKVITGISCSIFCILIITGLILWWPKRNNRKQRFRVKWNASSFKRLNWDLHAVFGFYVHIILLMISLTGIVWSFNWVNNLLFIAFDGNTKNVKITAPKSAPEQGTNTAFLEQIVAKANATLPYEGHMLIRYPEKDSMAFTVSKNNPKGIHSNVSDFLYFQAGSAKLLKVRLYDNESKGTIARRWIYPIHTGGLWGLPTKIIVFIAALVALTLPVSGFLIWIGKKKKKLNAKVAKVKKESALDKHPNSSVQYQ